MEVTSTLRQKTLVVKPGLEVTSVWMAKGRASAGWCCQGSPPGLLTQPILPAWQVLRDAFRLKISLAGAFEPFNSLVTV